MKELIDAGLTSEQLILVAKIIEEKQSIIDEKKRKDRDRKRNQRNKSRDSHGTIQGQSQDMSRTPPSLSSSSSSPLIPPFLPAPSFPPIIPPSTPSSIPTSRAPGIFPDWLPVTEWKDYLEMRRRIRKPATEKAQELLLKDLERLREKGHDPTLVLQQSIKSSWQGIFELKQGVKDENKRLTKSERAAAASAAGMEIYRNSQERS